LGDLDPYLGHRRATTTSHADYTLECEEPVMPGTSEAVGMMEVPRTASLVR
jgi:hypothetical protein